MKVQIFTCLLLLLVAGIFSLPTQLDDDSKAVDISSSGTNANRTSDDLASFCVYSYSYRIIGIRFSRANKRRIDNALDAFFTRLCAL